MKAIDPAGFERAFQKNTDPWNYRTSPFEHFKRNVLLRACGCRIYGRGLEVGCAIGETTPYLSRRCLKLLAVDSSPTALRAAKKRLRGNSQVRVSLATLPKQMPHGPFDLIVVSEIVYYLRSNDLAKLICRLISELALNGRIVLLDHIVPFADASQLPARAHGIARRKLQKALQTAFCARFSRFEVIAFRKCRTRQRLNVNGIDRRRRPFK